MLVARISESRLRQCTHGNQLATCNAVGTTTPGKPWPRIRSIVIGESALPMTFVSLQPFISIDSVRDSAVSTDPTCCTADG